ncbi:MAG TPA: addiction module family protein [Kaistella chaponensis]|nr:addiction module family protein [Kaistella chaponensis]
METTINLKKRIHEFIEEADERMLRIFNGIIEAEKKEEFELSDEQKEILNKRLLNHSENPNDGKSWSEVKQSLKEEYGISADY